MKKQKCPWKPPFRIEVQITRLYEQTEDGSARNEKYVTGTQKEIIRDADDRWVAETCGLEKAKVIKNLLNATYATKKKR